MTTQPAGIPPPQPESPCPCGSGKTFAACCAPVLAGQRSAATAEELMRSRFTAHVVRDFRHLHRTYLPTAHQPYVEEADAPEIAWSRLVIHSHEPDVKPDTSHVDFSAYFLTEGGGEQAMHEKSEFRRIDGAWIFARTVREGPAPVRSAHPKVGRNDPCPCGSGKKYKHCCMSKA